MMQKKLCAEDILYWIKMFCFILEPRALGDERDIPYFPYYFQEDEFRFLVDVIRRCASAHGPKENIIEEKSRDMGISWIVTHVFLWFFLFHAGSFLIGSRKEEEVDRTGDMDTPFQKMKYQLLLHQKFCPFLLPEGWDFRKHTGNMSLRNPMGGQIVGESANPDFGRGGRNMAILYDEFAKWEYAAEAWRAGSGTTRVRIAVSTPHGDVDKFARLRFGLDGEVIVRTHHWTMHPEKAKDLEIVNGKPTSSWYREECRTSNPDDIAKEVDISYAVSIQGRVFDTYGFGNQKKGLKPVHNSRIIRAWDPGLHFYVLFGQVDGYGRFLFLKEYYAKSAHLDDVVRSVLDISARYFGDYEFEDCGDPYGSRRQVSQQQEPEYGVLQRDYGIRVESAYMDRIPTKDRVTARIQLLQRKMTEGVGITDTLSLLVDPDECPILDRAFGGEYRRKIDTFGGVIDQIDEVHPSEDAVDCAGMLGLFKCPWGAYSYSKRGISVQRAETVWRSPGKRGMLRSVGRNG
jgi:hypothetical protein